MSLHQLFCNNPAIAQEQQRPFKLELDPLDRKHVRALRLQVGEHIALVDASSDYFEVSIEKIEGDDIWVAITDRLTQPENLPSVNLVQGLAKGNKMDDVLRQTTELGIAGFYPVAMKRSIVMLDERKAQKRKIRFEAIARSASLQSGRISIPYINDLISLDSLVENFGASDGVLLFWEEAPLEHSIERLFLNLVDTSELDAIERFWVIIGPEGGISKEEKELIESSHARVFTLSLGPTILRTETAGVVSTALVLSALRAQRMDTVR